MKQILRYSFVALLAMVGFINATASTIVFADLSLENGVQYTDPFDAGDFTVTFAGGDNDGKYYNTGSGIRVYGNGTMTIAAKTGTLTKLFITFDGSNKPTSAEVVSTGTYDVETGVWTGDAASVVFTRPSGSGHWRVQKVSNEEGNTTNPDPTTNPSNYGTADAPLTVAEAIAIANAAGTTATKEDVYAKGVVTEIVTVWNSQYKNVSFNISNDGGTTVIQAFRCKSEAEDYVLVGDEVVVKGKVKMYGTTPEFDASCEIVSLKQGEGHNGTPDTPEIQEVNVAKALEIINALEDGKTTSEEYQVKGKVIIVTEISTQYGNATFVIADEATASTGLTVYRVKGFNGANIDDSNIVKVGDEVVVKGNLQRYVKDGNITPELAIGGKIVSVNGATSGIEALKAGEAEGAIYNLAGQRVEKAVKGLYIKNGKKFIVK